jgi:hypothetical protein
VLLEPRGDAQGILYLAQLPGGAWLLLSGAAPADAFEGARQDVFEPFILSLDVPARQPEPTPAPAEPVALEPYVNDGMGLTFDAPAGWLVSQPTDINNSEEGSAGVVFYANPGDDRDTVSSNPTAPAIMVLHITDAAAIGATGDFTPVELLKTAFDLDPDAIDDFPTAAYPAARAFVEGDEDTSGVVYALAPGPSDWVIVVLAVPAGSGNVRLLDETLAMPLVRSITLSEPVE